MPRRASAQAKTKKRKSPPQWTSNAARKRRMPNCSLSSLKDLEDEETLESNFIGYFGHTSEAHSTWGKSQTAPIAATKKKRRAARFTKDMYGSKPRIRALFGLEEVDGDGRPNGPERSWFLGWPLEVREGVYEKLLVWREGIVVKHDLGQVESDNLRCIPILRVCRQIKAEAESYMYRHNVFRAINRNPRITYHLHESFKISPSFLPLLRNLIFECTQQNWGSEWYKNATTAISKLVAAQTPLQSLTLVVVPQQSSTVDAAMRVRKTPITFADFFWSKGPLMRAFKGLRCKTFNVIVKKNQDKNEPETEEIPETLLKAGKVIRTRRFFFSIDLSYSGVGNSYTSELINDDTIKIRAQKRKDTAIQMSRLKNRFECIFVDHNRAVDLGLCREMGADEPMLTIV